MRCRRPFFSEDVVRLRLCGGDAGSCRGGEDRYAQGETGGSPGDPGHPGTAVPVPALGPWGVPLLGALLGALGWRARRRRV